LIPKATTVTVICSKRDIVSRFCRARILWFHWEKGITCYTIALALYVVGALDKTFPSGTRKSVNVGERDRSPSLDANHGAEIAQARERLG